MPYSYQIANVLTILQQFVANVLTTAGEPPAEIPFTFALEQYPFDPTTLPLTVFEIGSTPIDQDNAGVDTIYFELPVTIHHARSRVAGQNAEIIALQRIAAIGVAFQSDYRLLSIDAAHGVPIHNVKPGHILIGDDSKMQVILSMNEQAVGLCAVSMPVQVCWYEGNQ